MIRYALTCDREHEFEGWFAASADFDDQQARGLVTTQFTAPELLLAMVSLTMFPVAFPQLTRMILGRAASAPAFRRRQAAFLTKFAAAFEPAQRRRKLAPGSKST